jgi:alanine dehydrogenase
MPYILKLADQGALRALSSDPGFMRGLNVAGGKVTYEPVAKDQGLDFTPPAEALQAVAA